MIEQYWRGEERYLPSIEALPRRAQAGVHRGRIQGLDATWYQRDDEEPVLAATAVANHAATRANGGYWPPEFARALGAAWHAYQEDGPAADHRQVFKDEFDGDHLQTWTALAKRDPKVTPPEEVPESEWWDDEPQRKVRFHADQYVMMAAPTYGGWELSTNVQPVARELLFATTVDEVGIGGQVDRVVTSHGDELPAGIYAVETKLAGAIRREHILQTEAYRRVFWPQLEPVDAVIVRVDPIEQTVETLSTRDDGWPDDAWEQYRRAHDAYREEHPLVDVRMRQSVWH